MDVKRKTTCTQVEKGENGNTKVRRAKKLIQRRVVPKIPTW